MTRRTRTALLARAAVIPLATLAAAGCGGGGVAAKPSGGASATVSVANTRLGKILG
jgi:hypothetical protein